MRTFDDLKVIDLQNGKVLAVMDKSTWKTIADIIEWASKAWNEKKAEAELKPRKETNE